MKFTKIILFFFIFSFLFANFLFSQIAIELLEPKNGAYINFTPITFSFFVKNTTNLDENNSFDPTNISCFLRLQYEGKIFKKGPLKLPINQKGEIGFKTLPYGHYIWSVECLSISSEYRIMIFQNQTYEDFLKELKKQKDLKEVKENQTKINKEDEKNLSSFNPYLIVIIILVILSLGFYFWKKTKK